MHYFFFKVISPTFFPLFFLVVNPVLIRRLADEFIPACGLKKTSLTFFFFSLAGGYESTTFNDKPADDHLISAPARLLKLTHTRNHAHSSELILPQLKV